MLSVLSLSFVELTGIDRLHVGYNLFCQLTFLLTNILL